MGQLAAGTLWPGGLRRDEALISLPVAHIMGFVALLATAVAGLPVHFRPRFRPDEVLDAIEARRCTVFVGVPAMYRMLEEAGAADRDLTSIRVWASGADAMPSDLARRFKSYGASATLPVIGPVGEAVFAEGYGMVEMGGGVATKISPPYLAVGPRRLAGGADPPALVPGRRRRRQDGRSGPRRRTPGQGPGRAAELLGGTRRHGRGADRRRVAAHR